MPFSRTYTTKGRPPSLPFVRLKEAILGDAYDLSLVFVSSARSQELNRTYRKRDKPANVLSFPLDEETGEVFIDLAEAKRQAPSYSETYRKFVAHLFIHGLFHLKGFTHGSTMEREERKIRSRFHLL